ncbi:MAG: N-acetylmuramoyl-L-alanine amidase [Acidobacterium ailaaui]|nr:N-acetylmuramoyl-L-alanine amidase [Pseudacidobacterium ailaaui]MCL6464764.1 N-acetylmuramoyl-L-alanine amidase [Pseudacidobacterium ailaaui]
MPHPYRTGGRTLFLCLLLACASSAFAAQHTPLSPYEKAQRMREALEGRPEQQRTRRDYERVLNAYRSIYHSDPASPKADASISAVAELLAEQGRIFQDEKSLHDAIGQYEFLRKQYPASRFRYSALLTEGEIYLHDLDDRASAKAVFQQFLRLYPKNSLAEQARQELSNIHKQEIAAKHRKPTSAQAKQSPGAKPLEKPPSTPEAENASVRSTGDLSRPQPAAATDSRRAQEPAEGPRLSDAAMNAPPPPPRKGRLPLVTGIRHWSTPVYTRVAIDLQDEVQYEASRVPDPDRIFFDLHGARLAPELVGKSVEVTDDGFLKRVRAAQFSNDVTRIVLDVSDVSEYSAFLLPNPWRLIIDVHGKKPGTAPLAASAQPAQNSPSGQPSRPEEHPPAPQIAAQKKPLPSPSQPAPSTPVQQQDSSSAKDIAALDRQPNRVKATRHPTTAPVVQTVAGTKPEEQPNEWEALRNTPPPQPAKRSGKATRTADANALPAHEAQPTATGERSMVRALGLKIGRIVVDAGHGGHDSGTLGPGGIEEKDVVLDVALRLGKLLRQRLGADVIYTRDDDTFIPLETRTAIANKAQADLFISVHANSSQDPSARGVETYYLNFTTSADALEVAARENAVSDQSIHQLSDLVKKIALQDKISESREFATDVQESLFAGLQSGNPGLKDRGVKKAPFVVLIGANMPSILAEISFLTNPDDARELRDPEYRQRIAESLYRGVARYVSSLSGVRIAQNESHSSGN